MVLTYIYIVIRYSTPCCMVICPHNYIYVPHNYLYTYTSGVHGDNCNLRAPYQGWVPNRAYTACLNKNGASGNALF